MISPLVLSGRKATSPLVHGALEEVDDALERRDAPALYRALQDPSLALRCLRRDNLDRYLEQLSMDREQKALVGTCWYHCWGGTPGAKEGPVPPFPGLLCGPAAFCKGAEVRRCKQGVG